MRVVVTRRREQAGDLCDLLEARGHEVVVCPLIEIEPVGPEGIDASGYDWVIVTSPNGARELARRVRGLPRVAAVGPGTAETLRALGIEPAFVPAISSQDGLLGEFPRPAGRVLFAAAEGARRGPVDELGADFVALYRTRPLRPATLPEGDVVVIASGSAARAFAELDVAIPAVTIGPQTTSAAETCGLRVVAEAVTHDVEGLVDAIDRIASRAA